MIVDEAAATRPGYIHIGILPLLLKADTALMLISTPGAEGNVLNLLVDKRERDDPSIPCFIVAVIDIVCDECKGSEKELTCKHIYKQPYWKDMAKIRSISNLYSDPKMARRELLGKDDGEEGKAFEKKSLEKFRSSSCKFEEKFVDHIYVGIDTDGCGDLNSETAIISFFKYNKKMVILGLDGDNTVDLRTMNKMLLGHIDNIRKQPFFRKGRTKIIIMPEAFALNTFILEDLFTGLEDVHMCYTKKSKTIIPGMQTTNKVKVVGVQTIRKFLRSDRLCFSSRFFTSTFGNLSIQQSIDKIKDKLFQQMRNFREILSYTSTGLSVYKYSGKLNEKGKMESNNMDDLVMSMVIGFYWMDEALVRGCDSIIVKRMKIQEGNSILKK